MSSNKSFYRDTAPLKRCLAHCSIAPSGEWSHPVPIECACEDERRWKNAKRPTKLPQAPEILGSRLVVNDALT